MGQHKFNPTAQAAQSGELSPRVKPISKRKAELLVRKQIQENSGLPSIVRALGGEYFYV